MDINITFQSTIIEKKNESHPITSPEGWADVESSIEALVIGELQAAFPQFSEIDLKVYFDYA
jgi:hypothetical protein